VESPKEFLGFSGISDISNKAGFGFTVWKPIPPRTDRPFRIEMKCRVVIYCKKFLNPVTREFEIMYCQTVAC
jgi:hypothetical protein